MKVTKRSCHLSINILIKWTEIQLVAEELKERHGKFSFTNEQFTAWAHMLQIKKHDSYDTPPKKAFLKEKIILRKQAALA